MADARYLALRLRAIWPTCTLCSSRAWTTGSKLSLQLGSKVPHKTVRNLMERYPRLALAFAWDMALDGAIQREWMASMGRRSAYEQTAHVLCELLIRLRAVGLAPDNQYDLHMTQEDLADAFGISAVHVNRMLQALRRDGLIELKASLALKILDIQGLKDAAGFEPAYLQ